MDDASIIHWSTTQIDASADASIKMQHAASSKMHLGAGMYLDVSRYIHLCRRVLVGSTHEWVFPTPPQQRWMYLMTSDTSALKDVILECGAP